MDEADKKIENRAEKVKSWLKQPYNLALVAVLAFAFVIRLYYYILTRNQPLWWDELCYASLAKNMVSHAWDGTWLIVNETGVRPLIFSFFWSLLLRINFGEAAVRFCLVFVPSVLTVILVYLAGKEIYGKRTGIISAFIYGVLWINLFYTGRLLVHMLDLTFLFLSILIFIKSVKPEGEPNYKYFAISLILLCLATMTRFQDGIVFPVYLAVLLLTKRLYLNKLKFWISGIIGISPLLLFFIINFILFNNIFPALFGNYLQPFQSSGSASPIAFHLLSYIPLFLTKIFFVPFLIGLALLVIEICLGYDLISKKSRLMNSLLIILIMAAFYSFFIFYIRGAEDRWLFEITMSLSIITAVGIDFAYNFLKKYNKILAVIFVCVLLVLGAYAQISFADPLIKEKKGSYLQIKQAFEWMGKNTPEDSVIIGTQIQGYAIYYANRAYFELPEKNLTGSGFNLDGYDYLVVHAFIGYAPDINEYLQMNQKKLEIFKVFFFDEDTKQQPAVIIYSIKHNQTG